MHKKFLSPLFALLLAIGAFGVSSAAHAGLVMSEDVCWGCTCPDDGEDE